MKYIFSLPLLCLCLLACDKQKPQEGKPPPTSPTVQSHPAVQTPAGLTAESSIEGFILKCSKEVKEELTAELSYQRSEWAKIPNPIIATYTGVEIGDYFHLSFEDADQKGYDFGFGNNDYGAYELITQQDESNPAFLNKTFKVFWEWKLSTFPCCSGGFEMVEAYQPSIVKLELVKE